jgi:transcriptional regulator with XRE-family HTH domain
MRYFLVRARISQGEMAKRLGVTDAAVSFWLSDDTKPTHANLLRFCKECGVDLPTFYRTAIRPRKIGRSA